MPVEEVERYHSMGIGYGILAQFYSIANNRCGATTSYTVDQLVAMKLGGMGMGEIRKQALGSASANTCNLGRLKQGDLDQADAQVPPGKDKSGTPAPSQKPHPSKPAAPAQPPKKPAPPKPNKPEKQKPPKKEAKPAPPKKEAKPAPPKPGKQDGNKGGGGGKNK